MDGCRAIEYRERLTALKSYLVTEDSPKRLVDYAIGLFEELPTKSSVKKAIKSGELRIDGSTTNTGTFPKTGMELELYDLQLKPPKAYDYPVDVVYEDTEIAVVNKPSGVTTSGNQYRTLENMLVGKLKMTYGSTYLKWPKPVHRLDNLTSGLVLVAKSINARLQLGNAFERQAIQKTYHALVMGQTPKNGILDSEVSNKPAETHYERIDLIRSLHNDHLSLIKLHPKTGRTHQLRIHCAHAGFPIYGDQLYAGKTIRRKGLFLAATGLAFEHPTTKKRLEITIDLPSKFYNRMQHEQAWWEKHNISV